MARFVVRFYSETAVRLEDELRFEIPNNMAIIVRDGTERDANGVATRVGLAIDALCSADDADHAVSLTQPLVEGVLSSISLSVSAAVKPSRLENSFDVTAGSDEHELVQHLPLPSQIRPARRFRLDAFGPIWHGLTSLPLEDQPWVMRAMRWYRKGLLEDDIFDEFVNFWQGLEALNPLMRRKYSLKGQTVVRACPHCGKEVVVMPTLAGVKHVVVDLCEASPKAWSEILDVRNGLSHG